MYKFSKKLVLFAFIPVIPVYLLAKYDNLDRLNTNELNIIKLSQSNKFDSLDILFIGSSYCYSGVYPVYFDSAALKTYNLGIGAAGPYFYTLILNDYIKSVKSFPKSIFIQVAPNTFSSVCDNFLAYPIHRYLNEPVSNEEVGLKYNYLSKYPEMEIKSFSKAILNLSHKNSTVNSQMIVKVTKNKGFLENYGTRKIYNEKKESIPYLSLVNDKFDEKKFNCLILLAHNLKKSGINVVFFEIPTYKLSTFFNAGFLNRYFNSLETLGKEFILFRNDIELTQDQFRNIDHINTQGAVVFTRHFLTKIYQNRYLKSLLFPES